MIGACLSVHFTISCLLLIYGHSRAFPLGEEEEEEEEDAYADAYEEADSKDSKAERKRTERKVSATKSTDSKRATENAEVMGYFMDELVARNCQALLCKLDNKPMPKVIIDDVADEMPGMHVCVLFSVIWLRG
jgi:hypothetical protein